MLRFLKNLFSLPSDEEIASEFPIRLFYPERIPVMTHECPIDGCQHRLPREKLMCLAHWRMVPGRLGRAVYRTYNSGHGAGTAEHAHAMEAAIDFVNDYVAETAQ